MYFSQYAGKSVGRDREFFGERDQKTKTLELDAHD
jgi:hypothetical protein